MAAFVVSASTFVPAPASGRRAFAGAAVRAAPAGAAAAAAGAPTMAADWSLDKYAGMAGAARGAAPPRPPSSMSTFQRAYLDSLKLKYAPYRAAVDPETAAARGESAAAILARGARSSLAMAGLVNAGAVAMGGDATTDVVGGPTGAAADAYMAASVRSQFKATAVPFGVVRWFASVGGGGGLRNGVGGGRPPVQWAVALGGAAVASRAVPCRDLLTSLVHRVLDPT